MEPHIESQAVRSMTTTLSRNPCTHGRIIDDVLTRSGRRTGQVRCLECGTIFDDPNRAKQ